MGGRGPGRGREVGSRVVSPLKMAFLLSLPSIACCRRPKRRVLIASAASNRAHLMFHKPKPPRMMMRLFPHNSGMTVLDSCSAILITTHSPPSMGRNSTYSVEPFTGTGAAWCTVPSFAGGNNSIVISAAFVQLPTNSFGKQAFKLSIKHLCQHFGNGPTVPLHSIGGGRENTGPMLALDVRRCGWATLPEI